MKILITGAEGFVGRNLVAELSQNKEHELYLYTKESTIEALERYTQDCEFIFHLAGVNRPQETSEFMEGNFGFTSTLLELLKKHQNTAPIVLTSSIQATLDNPYGQSKKAGEDALFAYAKETGAKVYVYRLANLFGKWSRPNYNSVVSTFCYNTAHDLPIQMNQASALLTLCYIDDVLIEFKKALNGQPTEAGIFFEVPVTHQITLGDLAATIQSFKESRQTLAIVNMANPLTKKLYSTYLSYLPTDQFSYPLKMNTDDRGSFTEFIRTPDRGQVSINVSKPGITKGNHWHHTKNEKFLVVAGQGVIRFRPVDSEEVIEYFVSGDKLEVVDIPVGYTHNIENLGETEMVTVMWVNECFDPNQPDTYFMEV